MRLRIRELREDNDIKQRELADLLHVRQATYSRYENGITDIPLDALIKLADYFNTSIDYLLGRTDDPTFVKKSRKKP